MAPDIEMTDAPCDLNRNNNDAICPEEGVPEEEAVGDISDESSFYGTSLHPLNPVSPPPHNSPPYVAFPQSMLFGLISFSALMIFAYHSVLSTEKNFTHEPFKIAHNGNF